MIGLTEMWKDLERERVKKVNENSLYLIKMLIEN